MINLYNIDPIHIDPVETVDCDHCKAVCNKDDLICPECGAALPIIGDDQICAEEVYQMSIIGRILFGIYLLVWSAIGLFICIAGIAIGLAPDTIAPFIGQELVAFAFLGLMMLILLFLFVALIIYMVQSTQKTYAHKLSLIPLFIWIFNLLTLCLSVVCHWLYRLLT